MHPEVGMLLDPFGCHSAQPRNDKNRRVLSDTQRAFWRLHGVGADTSTTQAQQLDVAGVGDRWSWLSVEF